VDSPLKSSLSDCGCNTNYSACEKLIHQHILHNKDIDVATTSALLLAKGSLLKAASVIYGPDCEIRFSSEQDPSGKVTATVYANGTKIETGTGHNTEEAERMAALHSSNRLKKLAEQRK